MMCGIAGIRAFDGPPVEAETLVEMARLLAHRGPDESAVWSEGAVGLAHTRLSIIDLGGSHQPMHTVDGRWVIAFNGEIFNYRELRAELDYPFRTDGDTEVIVAGLATVGLTFVERLRGQFAFVAFDRSSGVLHLVRDRVGILPLYYHVDDRAIVFGSEVKAIQAGLPRRLDVDTASLDAYLTSRAVAAPFTMFEGVKKVQPGHRLEVRPDGLVSTHRYWSPPPVDEALSWTPSAAVESVDQAVRSAVTSALVADVPVGAYLSGGVDSSLIVATMKAVRAGQEVETFSAGFGDPRFDELPWARLVSQTIGTRHHEVVVRATDFEELWQELTWFRDAPVSEPADIAVFRLAQMARQHVTVVLSGEGGDELFGGYPKYRYARQMAKYAHVPSRVRGTIADVVEPRLVSRASKLRVAVRASGAPDESERLRTWFAPFTAPERRKLLGGIPSREPLAVPPGSDAVDRMLRHDLAAWLPDNLLERGDRMSMASSLELRPPLLDHRLVELAFAMPASVKVRRGTTKWVLKEVARRYLPNEIVDRKKVGFRVPLDAWFRSGLRDSMWDLLTGTESFVGQTFDRQHVSSLLQRHEGGRFNEESRLWTLMSLEVWHQTFMRGASVGTPRQGVSR